MKFGTEYIICVAMMWGSIAQAVPVNCSPVSGGSKDLAKVCTDESNGAYNSNSHGVLIFEKNDGLQCSLTVENIHLDPWHLDQTSGVATADLLAANGEALHVEFGYAPDGWGYDLFKISFSPASRAEAFIGAKLADPSGIKSCETIQDAGLQ